jgi:putative hydrolase of HD superfamily
MPEKTAPEGFSPDRLADFLFEAGMLRRTPRTGYQFLGSGAENVAEHSFRAALIGYVLAAMAGADAEHTAMLCLLHDFPEARTGDFNAVNKAYNTRDQRQAMLDAVRATGLEGPLLRLWEEQERTDTAEAALAHDADQLDLFLNLVEQQRLGNPWAAAWIAAVRQRLRTPQGQCLADAAEHADPAAWWLSGREHPASPRDRAD